jgi:hypothetical protein
MADTTNNVPTKIENTPASPQNTASFRGRSPGNR